MKFLFITDPPAYATPDNEVTVSYRHAARDSRFEFFHLPSENVSGDDIVHVAPVEPDLSHETFLTLSDRANTAMGIEDFDLVFCRSRKPFPDGYLEKLDRWTRKTRFLNNPLSKIEQTSAGFIMTITPAEFLPPMQTAGSASEAQAFFNRYGRIVIKRPGGTAGIGVYKVWREQGTLITDHIQEGPRCHRSLADVFHHIQDAPGQTLEIVRYLPGVAEGDKRIVVIDGEIWGCFVRRSQTGHWVHNTSSSPVDCIVTDITEHEHRAIAATVPEFEARGLRILGYDFLLDDDGLWKISEVNAGNVGAMGRLEQITGKPYMTDFLNWMVQFASQERCRQTFGTATAC